MQPDLFLMDIKGFAGEKVGVFDAGPEGYKAGVVAVIAAIHTPEDGMAALSLYEVREADAEKLVEAFSLLLLRFEDAKAKPADAAV